MIGETLVREYLSEATMRAAENAIRYLLSAQSLGGAWWDFPVSIGCSGPWVTGVVGEVLNECPEPLRPPMLEAALVRAVRYLERSQLPEGGWGYNEALPADCDSTAYAMIFLHSMGTRLENRPLAALRAFQREDGAFLTYTGAPPGHSWGAVHYDVHGPAVRALGRVLGRDHESAAKGLRYSVRGLDQQRVWPAFWWQPQVYSVYQNLLCLEELGALASISEAKCEVFLPTFSNATPLCTALSGLAAYFLRQEKMARDSLSSLLKTQLPDGSWPSSKALRVTDANCLEPWSVAPNATAGPLYRDTRRIFTTALALKLLQRSLQQAELGVIDKRFVQWTRPTMSL